MKFPFLFLFIIFVIWLTVKLKQSDKINRNSKLEFLEREAQANLTRKQSLDDLDYITIPIDKLPFCDENDDEISPLQEKIINLSKNKIVNLTGISNTDLKLTYGAANINDLAEYDRNFTELARTLYLWGKVLYERNQVKEAKTVLEFAVSTKTDISDIYIILADIYRQQGEINHIRTLVDKASELDSLMKNSIIRKLNDILSQYDHTDE